MSASVMTMVEWEFAKFMDEKYGHYTEEDWARFDAEAEADPEYQAWLAQEVPNDPA